jgi:hypothetical protein
MTRRRVYISILFVGAIILVRSIWVGVRVRTSRTEHRSDTAAESTPTTTLSASSSGEGSSPFDKLDPKVAIMQSIWASANSKSLDTYGRVIDQYGKPVVGAKIKAGIGTYKDFNHSGGEYVSTETDVQGKFSFLGIHGAGVGFFLEKPGYEYDQRLPSSSRPEKYVPDPDHPIEFRMWKLQGPDPMIRAHVHAYIPCNGKESSFDLLSGKTVKSEGDAIIAITRGATDLRGNAPFDWSLTIGIPGGGLQAINHDSNRQRRATVV